MKHLDQFVDKDPLKLKKYDAGDGQSQTKWMYIFLVIVPVMLILSLLFYVFGALTSNGENAPVTYNGNNPNDSSDNDQFSEDLPPAPEGDLYVDRSRIADSFEKIQVGLRIMPSQNDEQGIIVMKWTDSVNAEESQLGNKVDLGDHYFFYADTAEYFPILKYNPDWVPFGDALEFCIHLQWIKRDMMKMYDLYKTIQGFPTCNNAKNPKFRWQQEDPKQGVDFKVWDQDKFQVSGESECTSMGGVYKENLGGQTGGKCYTYKVVKRICLMVAFKEHPEKASYSWEYRGGCYGDGKIAVYEKALPGEEFHFDQVPIEVREDESLYGQITYFTGGSSSVVSEIEGGESTIAVIFYFLSSLSMLLALISAILFAVFFFRAWKSVQAGDRMKHQQQIDEQ